MKGQVDAPIELVIAVIILVLSMALGFYVIQQSETGRCLAQLRASTQHLQEAMQDIALGSTGTRKTVFFDMPKCGGLKVDVVWFVYFDKPEFCHACSTNYGGCWQIVPGSKTDIGYVRLEDAVACVNMPGKRIELQPKGGEACVQLSSNPCPIGDRGGTGPNSGSGDVCNANVPKSVWTGRADDSPSRWQTLGREYASYTITLEKSVAISENGGGEIGVINICAQQPGRK
jgi:hypothetical protein